MANYPYKPERYKEEIEFDDGRERMEGIEYGSREGMSYNEHVYISNWDKTQYYHYQQPHNSMDSNISVNYMNNNLNGSATSLIGFNNDLKKTISNPNGPAVHSGCVPNSLGNVIPTKGLRQFSLRVCKKVEEKTITTYNEVADELINEMGAEVGKGDQKNLRRRIYDALNVLMAIGIIKKAKKEIVWLGFPFDTKDDIGKAQKDLYTYKTILANKKKILNELLLRHSALKNLVIRNKRYYTESQSHSAKSSEKVNPSSSSSSSQEFPAQDNLTLPFILVSTRKYSCVNCEMLEDRTNYLFRFESPFIIHRDLDVLKAMGLCQEADDSTNTNFVDSSNTIKILSNLHETIH